MDFEEFLEKNQKTIILQEKNLINVFSLGLFFWERGGKQFALNVVEHEKTTEGKINDFPYICSEAEFYLDDYEDFTRNNINSKVIKGAQDFLNALACLGEEKVKELIKGVGGDE